VKNPSFFLVFSAISLFWSCADETAMPEDRAVDWWPVQIGSEWIYSTTWEDSSGVQELDPIKDTVSIQIARDESGALYVTTNGNYELGLPNALFFKNRRIEDGTGTVWFDLDRIGDTIHRIERSSYREVWIQEATALEWEGQSLPAIQLQRVREVFANFNYPSNYTLSIWYLKGLGIVRYTGKPLSAETLQVKQLVSYRTEP